MPGHKRYSKDLDYSYTIGVFPTIELLEAAPDRVQFVFYHSKSKANFGVSKIKEICEKNEVECEIGDKVISKISSKENVYAVGVFSKFESKIEKGENCVVLVNPSGAGNLGTIIRTAVGFGFKNLAVIEPSVDIFQPDVVRAAMGALFKINFQLFGSFEEFAKVGKYNVYPFMVDGSKDVADVGFKKPYALVFGSEGSGLSEDFHKKGVSVRIPQSKEIDSFNLAVSVGIGLYEVAKG